MNPCRFAVGGEKQCWFPHVSNILIGWDGEKLHAKIKLPPCELPMVGFAMGRLT